MKRLGAFVLCGMLWVATCAAAEGSCEPLRPDPEQLAKPEGLQKAFDKAAKEDRPVILPAGVFTFEDGVELNGIDVSGQGDETVLQGQVRNRNAIVLTGRGARLSRLAIKFEATKRSSHDESALVLVTEAQDFTVEDLTLSGGDSAGVFVRGSGPGKIIGNRIQDTLADAIHMTAQSHDIQVEGNKIRASGDDGIAVVSYTKNRGLTRNIDIVRNLVVDNKFARGISVVGGAQVRIGENEVRCNQGYAGILVASEAAFQTYGTQGIAVVGNRIEGCGGAKTGHGAIMLSRDNADHDGVWIESNYVLKSPYASLVIEGRGNRNVIVKDNGFVRFGDGPIVFRGIQGGVVLSGNTNKAPAWARLGTRKKKTS